VSEEDVASRKKKKKVEAVRRKKRKTQNNGGSEKKIDIKKKKSERDATSDRGIYPYPPNNQAPLLKVEKESDRRVKGEERLLTGFSKKTSKNTPWGKKLKSLKDRCLGPV